MDQSDEQMPPASTPNEPLPVPEKPHSPDAPQGKPPKEKSLWQKLFAPRSASEVVKSHEERLAALKPDKENWTPINVKTGPFKDPELWKKNKPALVHHISEDLQDALPGSANFNLRRQIAKDLASKRSRGISNKEILDEVKKMKTEGMGKHKLSPLQAKKINRYFGAKKRSFWS